MNYFMGELTVEKNKHKSNFSTAFRKTANFGIMDGIRNKATNDTHKIIDDAIDYGSERLKKEGSKYAQEFKSKIPEYWAALKKNKPARRLLYGFAALQGLQALTGIKSGIELTKGAYNGVKRLVTRKPKEQTAKFSAMVHVPNRQMKRGLSPDEIKYLMKIGGKTALGVGVIGGGIYGINKLSKRKKLSVRK